MSDHGSPNQITSADEADLVPAAAAEQTTMSNNTAGGAATAGGMDYQAQCAAWVSVQILAAGAAPPVEGLWTGPLDRVDCETAEPVDDISVRPRTGPAVVMQCKRSVSLTAAADGEFGKTIDQFVRQHSMPGHASDELVLVTTTEAPATIRNTLRTLLERIRTLPGDDGIDTAAKNTAEEDVLERVLAHIRRSWANHTGLEPTTTQTRDLIRKVHVLVLDLDPGQAAEIAAHAILAVVVADPAEIPSAWAHLNSYADVLAKNRTGADLPQLQQHLTSKQVDLVGIAELQPDVAKLEQLTATELDTLESGLVTIPGPQGDISIARAIIAEVAAAAKVGPVLITGEPGSGKTVAVHHLARRIEAEQGKVAFLAVGSIRAGSLGELRSELGLATPLYDVLAQWLPGTPKTLIIDSLDAARGDGQPDLWRQIIDHVRTHLPDWTVVATVRSWDLRNSKHLTRLFPHPPVTVDDLDEAELISAATGWTDLLDIVMNAPARLRALVRSPFSLRLVADLLVTGFPLGTLVGLDSQIQLLDTYWEQRVTSGIGGGARQVVTRTVSRRALDQHTMTVDTTAVLAGDTGASAALSELLSLAVLTDATALPHPGLPATIRYAHHVLHDYAVSLEFLGSVGLNGEVRRDPNIAIAAAPSIELHLQRMWDADPVRFWETVIELHDSGVAGLVVVQAADVAARSLTNVAQLAALLDPIRTGGDDAAATTLLRYLALAFVLDRREDPLTPTAAWAQLALELSNYLNRAELIVRILVSELTKADPPITGDDLTAAGTAARAALEHLWQGPPSLVNRIAIESVIQTAASDPGATEALLRGSLTPERLASHGPNDLWQLTDGIPSLVIHAPAFVRDLYVTVMPHEESSQEPTDMIGGQILPLRSNRRQDIESAKYNLVEHFDTVLAAAPDIALDILRTVVPTRTTSPIDETRVVNDRAFTITVDGSEWFDEWDYAKGSDPAGLLEQLGKVLATTDDPTTWLDLLAGDHTPAVIWRRVLSAASDNSKLAAELGPLDQVVAALALAPLASELAKLITARYVDEDHDTKRRAEQTVQAMRPADEIVDEPTYQQDLLYRHLLHALDLLTASPEVQSAIDASRPPTDRTHFGGPTDYDPYLGIDLDDPVDTQVAELLRSITSFAHAHFNEIPTVEQLDASSAAIDELESVVDRGYTGALASQATDVLTQVAVIWARLPSDMGAPLHFRARARLLEAMHAQTPEPSQDDTDDDGDEIRTILTGPRNDAARGLTTLARLPEQADAELLDAILTLSRDPVSSLRHEVVERLGYLHETAPSLVWEILQERAASDPSELVLRSAIYRAWTLRSDMTALLAVVETVARRDTASRKRRGAIGAAAEVAALIWVRFGNDHAGALTEQLLNLDRLDADAIGNALHTLRESATFLDDEESIRHRALDLCSALVAQCSARLATLAEAPPPTEEDVAPFREAALLLDSVAQQIYFAAGVHDAKQKGGRPPSAKEIRLIEDATPTLEQLADVALAHVAHHLVEIYAYLVEVRPSQALVAISRVVTGGGRASGYPLESLAVGTLVKVVTQLLADHRAIFDSDENLSALRTVLEVFIEAGSPDAHQLIYGLGSILR